MTQSSPSDIRNALEGSRAEMIWKMLEQPCQRADDDRDDPGSVRGSAGEKDASERRQFRQASAQDLLGPPALLPDEDPATFEELLSRVSEMLKPRDILEQIWVRDFVYFVWEQDRLRRIKVGLCDPADIFFELKITHMARVDQMSVRAGVRRDAILREIERYRNSAVLRPLAETRDTENVPVGEQQDDEPAQG